MCCKVCGKTFFLDGFQRRTCGELPGEVPFGQRGKTHPFWNWNKREKTQWSSFMDRCLSLFCHVMSFCEHIYICFLNAPFQASKHLTSMWYSPSSQGCRLCEAGRPELQHKNRGQLYLPIKDALCKSCITARKHQKHHIWTNLGKPKLQRIWQRQRMHINVPFSCKWPVLLKILGIPHRTIQFSIPGVTVGLPVGLPDTLGSNSRGPRAAKRVGSSKLCHQDLSKGYMVTSKRI